LSAKARLGASNSSETLEAVAKWVTALTFVAPLTYGLEM
jgi:hypothetical protein